MAWLVADQRTSKNPELYGFFECRTFFAPKKISSIAPKIGTKGHLGWQFGPQNLKGPKIGLKKKHVLVRNALRDFLRFGAWFQASSPCKSDVPFLQTKIPRWLDGSPQLQHTPSQAPSPMFQPRYRVSPKHRSTLGLPEVINLKVKFLVSSGLRNNSSCSCLFGCFKYQNSYGIIIYSPELPMVSVLLGHNLNP